jgi:hypothetical protein
VACGGNSHPTTTPRSSDQWRKLRGLSPLKFASGAVSVDAIVGQRAEFAGFDKTSDMLALDRVGRLVVVAGYPPPP